MTQKALITGITGFAGSHLAEYLCQNQKISIVGTYFTKKSLENVQNLKNPIDLRQIDLSKSQNVNSLVKTVQPNYIYHLAALASAADSFRNPVQTVTNNIAIQLNILEAIRLAGLSKCRILIISSADIYGSVSLNNLPIHENTPFMPMSPYAVSKITQDFLGLQFFISYNMDIVRVRPFNHIGPRQSTHFVVASFAKKIAEIEKGITPPIIKVGNLGAKRDFTDVRDIVRGYSLVMEKGKSGDVYNMGSGVSYKISDILDTLLSLSKISIKVEEDPDLIRPVDIPELVCDNRKLKSITHWEPRISLDQSLQDTLDYWRKLV